MVRARWHTFGILVLLASVGACATPTRQPEPVTITFACRNYLHDWYEGLAEAFHEEHPHITVQILSTDEILNQTAQTGVYTGSSGDIYKIAYAADSFLDDPRMLGERPQDVVLDLADRAARDAGRVLEDTYPSALAPFSRDGRLWGLPFEVNPLVVYFNPQRFDEAGVPHPQPGWTWDDLLDAAVRLTIRQDDRVQEYGYVDPQLFYTLPSLAHQKVGALVETRHEIPQGRLDAPGVAEAIRWYAGLVSEYGVMPDPTDRDLGDLSQIPYEQSPAMWVGGAWEWNNFSLRQDTGIVPLPESDGVGTAYITARGYYVSAGTTHPDVAWQWIEWLSRQRPQPYSQAVPARKSVIEASNYWGTLDERLVATYQYTLEHAVEYPAVLHIALSRAFEAVLGGTSAEAALADAQVRLNQALLQRAKDAEQPAKEFVVASHQATPMPPESTVIHFFVVEAIGADWSLYGALANRFHKEHPEIVVEIEAGMQPSLTGVRDSADCFVGRAYRAQLGSEGGILSLDPLAAGDETFDRDVFYPAFLHQTEIGGKLMALPLEASTQLLYYNRSLFDRAGLSYPTVEWTPRHLVEQAVALAETSAPEPVYGFSPHDGLDAAPEYVAWLGGQLFEADDFPTFDDPTVVAALALYADLVRSSPPTAQRRSVDRWSGVVTRAGTHPPAVSSGQVAMWVDEYDRHLGAPPLDFDVGLVSLPAGATSLESSSVRALFISAQTGVPDACWTWITFLSAQPEAVQWLPVRRDTVARDTWRAQVGEKEAAAWSTILGRGGLHPPSWGRSMASYYALYWLDKALTGVLEGDRPVDALSEAQAKASVFASCMSDGGDPRGAWPACARQADPDVVLPSE